MGDIPNHIRREAASKDVKPTVRVGRSGLTEALVEEVDGQLRQRAMVKIKVNRGVFDRENLALLWEALVERTGAVLVLSVVTSASCGVAEAQSFADLDDNGL